MDAIEIKVRLDKSHADKEAAAFHQAERRRAAETAKTQAKEAREAAREQQALLRSLEKSQRDAAREQARAAKEAYREQQWAAREADGFIRNAAREQAAEARRAAAEQARLDNRVLSETEIRERSKTAIYRRTNQQRIQELLKTHKTEIDKARESELAANRVMGSATSAVTSFAGQMVGLSGVSAVAGEIVAGFQRVRDSIFNSTELMQEFRETLLELAALKDRLGDTTTESIDVLRMQAQTGQKRQDVVDLQANMLGIGEAAVRGGKTTMEDVRKAVTLIGRVQAVQGADAGAYGRLGGLLLQTMPAGTKPEDIARETAGMYEMQQPGGFSSFGSAIDQFGKSMGYIRSGILSARQAMALTSVYSIAEPGEAATRLDQLMRGTVGAQGRDRRVNAPEGTDVVGTATYLQSLGVKGNMMPDVVAQMIQEDVARARAAGGEEFNPYSYLMSKGYGNQEDLKAILNFDAEAWNKTFKPMIANPDLGKASIAEADIALATDPALVGRAARSADEMQKMLAATPQEEWMRSMRQFGYARAGGQRAGLSEFKDIETSAWYSPMNWWSGQGQRVRDSTIAMIMEGADKMGIQYQGSIGQGGDQGGTRYYMSEAEQFRVSRELADRGYNFGEETMGRLVNAAENLNRAAGMLSSVAAPQPLQGAPQQPPAVPR